VTGPRAAAVYLLKPTAAGRFSRSLKFFIFEKGHIHNPFRGFTDSVTTPPFRLVSDGNFPALPGVGLAAYAIGPA
jgi:hypothetical protein